MQNLTIDEINEKLPSGSYKIISARLNGKYTPGTIRQMLKGRRKLQLAVYQEAVEYINFINPEQPETENKPE